MNKNFCCEDMANSVIECKIVDYDPIERSYGILFGKRSIKLLEYCPWCGVHLPKRLIEEFDIVLEKEYGITNPDIFGLTNVPEEFKSDEWWRRRGL